MTSPRGMHVIEEIVDIFGNYEFSTEVLVASVRIRSMSAGCPARCGCLHVSAWRARGDVQASFDRHRP